MATSIISKFIGTRITTLRRAVTTLQADTITKGAEIDHSTFAAYVAGTSHRWHCPFRRRGSRRRSAVAQLTQPLAGANAGWPLQSRIRG